MTAQLIAKSSYGPDVATVRAIAIAVVKTTNGLSADNRCRLINELNAKLQN